MSDAAPPKRRVKYEWKPKGVPVLISVGLLPVTVFLCLLAWQVLNPALGFEFTYVVGKTGPGVTCGVIAWATLVNCRPDDRRSWLTAAIAALAAALLTGTGIVWGGLVTLVEISRGNDGFIRWTVFLGGLVPGTLAVLVTAFLFGRQPVADAEQEVSDENDA